MKTSICKYLMYLILFFVMPCLYGQFNEKAVIMDSCFVIEKDTLEGSIFDYDNKEGVFTQYLRFTDNSPYPYGSITSYNRIWFEPIFKGEIKDGKRHGEWVFWHDVNYINRGNYKYCRGENKHSVFYFNDSTYLYGDFFNYKIISYNNDSTLIWGKIGYGLKDVEIKFDCNNNDCNFWYVMRKDTILMGKRDEFEKLLLIAEFEYLRNY